MELLLTRCANGLCPHALAPMVAWSSQPRLQAWTRSIRRMRMPRRPMWPRRPDGGRRRVRQMKEDYLELECFDAARTGEYNG